jgi:hypothetical protein
MRVEELSDRSSVDRCTARVTIIYGHTPRRTCGALESPTASASHRRHPRRPAHRDPSRRDDLPGLISARCPSRRDAGERRVHQARALATSPTRQSRATVIRNAQPLPGAHAVRRGDPIGGGELFDRDAALARDRGERLALLPERARPVSPLLRRLRGLGGACFVGAEASRPLPRSSSQRSSAVEARRRRAPSAPD